MDDDDDDDNNNNNDDLVVLLETGCSVSLTQKCAYSTSRNISNIHRQTWDSAFHLIPV